MNRIMWRQNGKRSREKASSVLFESLVILSFVPFEHFWSSWSLCSATLVTVHSPSVFNLSKFEVLYCELQPQQGDKAFTCTYHHLHTVHAFTCMYCIYLDHV